MSRWTALGLLRAGRSEEVCVAMKVGQKNSVCILSRRERGVQGLASHRILQQLVEEKTQRMKWQSQVTDAQTLSVVYKLILFY